MTFVRQPLDDNPPFPPPLAFGCMLAGPWPFHFPRKERKENAGSVQVTCFLVCSIPASPRPFWERHEHKQNEKIRSKANAWTCTLKACESNQCSASAPMQCSASTHLFVVVFEFGDRFFSRIKMTCGGELFSGKTGKTHFVQNMFLELSAKSL